MAPQQAITRMRVDQLRAELRARSLDISGTKQVLVARLQAALEKGDDSATTTTRPALPNHQELANAQRTPHVQSTGEPGPSSSSSAPPANSLGSSAVNHVTHASGSAKPSHITDQAHAKPVASHKTESGLEPRTSSSAQASSAHPTRAQAPTSLSSIGISQSENPGDKSSNYALPRETGVLVAPEQLTMEERLAARARRFGLTAAKIPEEAAVNSVNNTAEEITEAKKPTRKENRRGRTAPAKRETDGKADTPATVTFWEDRKGSGPAKRPLPSEPEVVTELISQEEAALRAKRARRFGLSSAKVA